MRHILTALTLSLVTILTACANVSIPFTSIQRLTNNANKGFCTSWATKVDGTTRWISAAHCLVYNEYGDLSTSTKYKVGDKDANLVKVNLESDLSMFTGPASAGFNVAFGEPTVGLKVKTFSYMLGSDGMYVEGVYSGRLNGGLGFSLPTAPGASGGAILDENNVVVGVMQGVPCMGTCPIVIGPTMAKIRAFLYNEEEK